MTAQAIIAPFVFNKDYHDNEQVRPYYAEYVAVRAALEAAGQYPYNDSFKGRIDSLSTTTSKNEDTAIYLLQTMHSLDALAIQVADFIAAGAIDGELTRAGEIVRGNVAMYGYYMGGTGWTLLPGARLTRDARGRLIVIQKGKRNGSYPNGKVLVQVTR